MADQKQYESKPFLYSSRGLGARWEIDRVPEEYYLQNLNCFERSEGSLSSRYGTTILNRDPLGYGTSNHFFPSPVTSIARLLYQASASRLVGLANGTLWQGPGYTQGAYSQIYSGLSGQPFTSLVTSSYESSQPYLYIADSLQSIKVPSTSNPATPQLWGIDPPPQTANALPYSPLLILIDNFAPGNSYTTAGFDVGTPWTSGTIFTITANSSSLVTDFPQFFGASTGGGSTYNPSSGGTSVTVTQFGNGSDSNTSSPVSGYPSVPITPGESVSVVANISADVNISSGFGGGGGTVDWQYSVDGGVTWPGSFYSWSFSGPSPSSSSLPPTDVPLTGFVISNLDLLQFRIVVTSTVGGPSGGAPDCTTDAQINSAPATVATAGALGGLISGMLSVLNGNPTIKLPIQSVVSTDLSGSFYHKLAVAISPTASNTLSPSASNYVALYGSSNDLVDGFYMATVTASNSFTVPYLSSVYLSAGGGFVMGGASSPSTCVLANNYAAPYPPQFSAWGFYQQVPLTTTSFPVYNWGGKVDTNTTATVKVTNQFDLSQNDQVTDFDLIVMTLQVGAPANVASIQVQFDVNGSNYTSSYYSATISPAFYQGSIAGQLSAYQSTQNQVLADALGLFAGQQPTGSTTAQLSPSNFSTGSGAWQTVYIPRGNFLPIGNAGQPNLDWSNITGWKIVIQTTTTPVTGDGSSTVAVNGLYLQWGYGPSSFAGVGYDWRYTYYDAATGTESSPSPIQNFNGQYGYLASLRAPFYLRQAAQITGYYSTDPQVTHLRIYRRGGLYASNWFLDNQVPNITAAGLFFYKDVIGDTFLSQASPLALDNDPPVTASLNSPIQTTLAAPTTGPGSSIYSLFGPQVVSVADPTIQFVVNQTVLVGNANNLEEVLVIAGGTGKFTAILRLAHNAGEQVSATSIPRQACSLCALSNQGGVTQVWLAGDPNNPHYLYYSKPGYPENFSPANYIPVSAPDDPIQAVINWRGTIVVGTTKTWYIIVGGAKPYAQPTGSAHGMAASTWALVEGEIIYLSQDGIRAFSGADGQYTTLPVEWMFRQSPTILIPRLSASNYSSAVLVQYQNQAYLSFQSASDTTSTGGGQRYRLRADSEYKRFGLDDVPATAMLWEQDTNTFLVGKQIPGQPSPSNYALVQDWTGDYDDGGWQAGSLVKTPIHLIPQTPFHDLGKPHFPKQWNMLEGDYNTQNQPIQTTLYFNTEPQTSLVLPAANTGSSRQKVQYQISQGVGSASNTAQGVQAYAMSVRHDMYVTVAPTFYQEDVYAIPLADYRTSWDSYWQGTEGDLLGVQPKNIYCDYTATAQLVVSIFADGDNSTPYYVDNFTLIPQATRSVVRVQLPARKGRLWRVVITSAQPFQLWAPVRVEVKPLAEGSGFEERALPVYQ